MKHVDINTFVNAFLSRFGLEGNMAYVTQQSRILHEIDDFVSKGWHTYEAIIKLCDQHAISFKIQPNSTSNITVQTFMDGRQWSHLSLQATKAVVSEKLGVEIANMMQTKYTNLIIIENSTKK